MNAIKQRLKWIRQKFDLSMAEFGEKIGVSAGNVGDWESDRRPTVPGARALISIAETFSVSLDWLLLGKSESWEMKWENFSHETEEERRQRKIKELNSAALTLGEEDLRLLVMFASRLQALSAATKSRLGSGGG